MKITRIAEAPHYTAPKHFDVRSQRVQGLDVTDSVFAWVGISYLSPQGGADMDAGTFEKIYVVLSGTITIQLGDGSRHTLNALDSCHIAAGESRSILNDTQIMATMLVIAPPAVTNKGII